MCGRLLSERYQARSQRDVQLAAERQRLARLVDDRYAYEALFLGRYNVAPTQDYPVLRAAGNSADLFTMRWRFLPAWSREANPRFNTINAMGETVATKPVFRTAWKRRQRCLIPVTGWYEWRGPPGRREPCLIRSRSERVVYLGGIWDRWQREDTTIDSFAIITVAANAALSALHPRMPLVIEAANDESWLQADADAAQDLVRPHAGSDWEYFPVSPALNNARNEGEELIRPQAAQEGGRA